jgi:glycosyltransferase involved in cell wall biosynthesis
MVSGALCYAVAAGLPIVSTPYLYAFEMLGNGRGMIVDFSNPAGIGECINLLLDSPTLRQLMVARTYEFGRRLVWDRIGAEHVILFRDVVAQPAAAGRALYPAPHYAPTRAAPAAALPISTKGQE